MKKILVTGGTGFVGRKILEKLSLVDGIEIYVVTRKKPFMVTNVKYLIGDLFNLELLEEYVSRIKPDLLLHLAWDIERFDYAESANNEKWVKVSKKLLEIFLKYGGEEVIASGTCFEYDLSIRTPHEESEVPKPKTMYGKAKLETYRIYKELCDRANARLVWGRIFYAYGENENPRKLLSAARNSMMNNEVFICKSPNNIIDYINVDEVADIFISFIFNSKARGIINVGTGEGKNIRNMLLELEVSMGKRNLLHFEESPCINIVANTKKLRSVYNQNVRLHYK